MARKQVPKVRMEYREHVVEKDFDFSGVAAAAAYAPEGPYPSHLGVASSGILSPPRSPPLGLPLTTPLSPGPLFRQSSSHVTRAGSHATKASSHVTTRPASPYGSRPGSMHLPHGGPSDLAGPAPRPPPSDGFTHAAKGNEDVAPMVTELDRDKLPPRPMTSMPLRPGVASSGRFASSAATSTGGTLVGGGSSLGVAGGSRRPTAGATMPPTWPVGGSLQASGARRPATMQPAAGAAAIGTVRPATMVPNTARAVSGARFPATAQGSILGAPLPPTGTLPQSAF